jgi:hypothetical protein
MIERRNQNITSAENAERNAKFNSRQPTYFARSKNGA